MVVESSYGFFMSENPQKNKKYQVDDKPIDQNSDFEAEQNLLGFFDLLLKSSTPDVLKIFATLFIFQNECFYSLVCLILLFLIINDQKLEKLTIKRDGFSIEFLKEHKK